jgi:hypothetical protein
MRELAFPSPSGGGDLDIASLEIERDAIVRARVLLDCALIEELTALIIMNFLLSDSPRWRKIKYFGRIKRYHLFYDSVLARLSGRQKFAVVKKIIDLPRDIRATVDRMFALRDVLAHVYTFDSSGNRALEYKGKGVLTKAGFASYVGDSSRVISWLMRKYHLL